MQLRAIDACRVASRSSCGGTARVSLERAEASGEGYLTQASTDNASHCGGKKQSFVCDFWFYPKSKGGVCGGGGIVVP